MISLLEYINEVLKTDAQKWLETAYKINQTLIRNNKLKTINVDVKNMNKPRKSFKYDQFNDDLIFKKVISDKFVGFPITNQLIRNTNKYFKDGETQLTPQCYPYWYVVDVDNDTQNMYFVGLCIFDTNNSYINNYVSIINIETSLIVENTLDVNKALLNDFIHTIQRTAKYEGIAAKPIHPKIKSTLIKLGFKPSKDNKEVLTYKI